MDSSFGPAGGLAREPAKEDNLGYTRRIRQASRFQDLPRRGTYALNPFRL
jgi:hypothetical protein